MGSKFGHKDLVKKKKFYEDLSATNVDKLYGEMIGLEAQREQEKFSKA